MAFWNDWWRGPSSQPSGDPRQQGPHWSDNNVRMGVGHNSARELDMTIHTDRVIQGRESVHLASGNHANRNLRAQVYGNTVDSTRDLSIGVGNDSGGGNSLIVRDNEIRGRQGDVNIGVGNRSRGAIKIVVAGNTWRESQS